MRLEICYRLMIPCGNSLLSNQLFFYRFGKVFIILLQLLYFICICIYMKILILGVILAILEMVDMIYSHEGEDTYGRTVSAGYQNFLISIEMFFAALALR